jgi:hypothetical protein
MYALMILLANLCNGVVRLTWFDLNIAKQNAEKVLLNIKRG